MKHLILLLLLLANFKTSLHAQRLATGIDFLFLTNKDADLVLREGENRAFTFSPRGSLFLEGNIRTELNWIFGLKTAYTLVSAQQRVLTRKDNKYTMFSAIALFGKELQPLVYDRAGNHKLTFKRTVEVGIGPSFNSGASNGVTYQTDVTVKLFINKFMGTAGYTHHFPKLSRNDSYVKDNMSPGYFRIGLGYILK